MVVFWCNLENQGSFFGFNALRYAFHSFPFDYFRDGSEAERVKNSRLFELFFRP